MLIHVFAVVFSKQLLNKTYMFSKDLGVNNNVIPKSYVYTAAMLVTQVMELLTYNFGMGLH
jgi:hypothetical protein